MIGDWRARQRQVASSLRYKPQIRQREVLRRLEHVTLGGGYREVVLNHRHGLGPVPAHHWLGEVIVLTRRLRIHYAVLVVCVVAFAA